MSEWIPVIVKTMEVLKVGLVITGVVIALLFIVAVILGFFSVYGEFVGHLCESFVDFGYGIGERIAEHLRGRK